MKKIMEKIINWLLFGKSKKEDFADLIVWKVEAITKRRIIVDKLIAELKTENDAMKFEEAIRNVRQIDELNNDLKGLSDIYKSINKYMENNDLKVKEYRETLALICYGAKFI